MLHQPLLNLAKGRAQFRRFGPFLFGRRLARLGLGLHDGAHVAALPERPRELLRGADREPLGHDPLCKQPVQRLANGEDGTRMACADRPLRHKIEDSSREFEQAQCIRHGGSALAHPIGHLLLRHAIGAHQPLVGVSLFERVEVAPLHVLDQRQQEGVCVGSLVHHDGHMGEPSQFARTEPAFARDEAVAAVRQGTHDERLNDPRLGDRGRELADAVIVEADTRLVEHGVDEFDGDINDRASHLFCVGSRSGLSGRGLDDGGRCWLGALRNQRAKAAPQPLPDRQFAHDPSSLRLRSTNSFASAM